MMMHTLKKLAALGAAFGIGSAAYGLPVLVESQDPGVQDPLFVDGWVHELGDLFPPDELIASIDLGPIQQTSCFDGSDDPVAPNYLIEITNLTQFSWPEVYYVADWDTTTISNFDGFIGNAGVGDLWYSFRIDSAGTNRPLIFESLITDNVFQPGEVWRFIVQDFTNAFGGPPAPFDSPGIAGASLPWPPSTGSIIAVPEPGMLGALMLGLCVLLRRRR